MSLIFKACLYTVIIETIIFYLAGYRKAYEIGIVICANTISNLSLNLFLSVTGLYTPFLLIVLEAVVVFLEYLIYLLAFDRTLKLFVLTIVANLCSFLIGRFLF